MRSQLFFRLNLFDPFGSNFFEAISGHDFLFSVYNSEISSSCVLPFFLRQEPPDILREHRNSPVSLVKMRPHFNFKSTYLLLFK